MIQRGRRDRTRSIDNRPHPGAFLTDNSSTTNLSRADPHYIKKRCSVLSRFQNSVSFEGCFAFAPVSSIGFADTSKPCANAAIYGSSFKMRLHFEDLSKLG
jgi:hypothetical protein